MTDKIKPFTNEELAEYDRMYADIPDEHKHDTLMRLRETIRQRDAEIAELRKRCEAGETAKNSAYSERNKMVCFLTLIYPSHLKKHPESDIDWDRGWMNIVCVHSPMGQLTWHIHDSECQMFSHLEQFPDCEWDGHTTEEKYHRLMNVNTAAFLKEGK